MKNLYFFLSKPQLAFIFGLIIISLYSCGTSKSIHNDGIYGDQEVTVTKSEAPTTKSKKYETYFKKKADKYENVPKNDVFTNIDEYESDIENQYEEEETLEKEVTDFSYNNSAWEDTNNVVVNVYNIGGYHYNPYRNWYNPNYARHNFYNSPFYYSPFYSNYYGDFGYYGGYYNSYYGSGYNGYGNHYGHNYNPYSNHNNYNYTYGRRNARSRSVTGKTARTTKTKRATTPSVRNTRNTRTVRNPKSTRTTRTNRINRSTRTDRNTRTNRTSRTNRSTQPTRNTRATRNTSPTRSSRNNGSSTSRGASSSSKSGRSSRR